MAGISLAETEDFELGGLQVSPARRQVRMNGTLRELEPRVAQVLVALAAARPKVVSRDQLIEQCWDGRIVGDDAINRCIVALRQLARDFTPEPFAIETVARVGYSLHERPAEASAKTPSAGTKRERAIAGSVALLLFLAIVAGLGWWRFGRDQPADATAAKFAASPTSSPRRDARSDANRLYQTAQSLLRTHNRRQAGTAADLLRDAITIDPEFAPAWASLATATRMDASTRGQEAMVTAIPLAQGYARQALRLAPDLAEGHLALAQLLGHGDPEGQGHCRRAVELDPENALVWEMLAVCHEAVGEFEQAMADRRRAGQLDPHAGFLESAVADMGDRTAAEAIVKQSLAQDPMSFHMTMARMDIRFGDYSEAARRWSIVANAKSPRWSQPAREFLNEAKFPVGLPAKAYMAPNPPLLFRKMRTWMEVAPPPDVWRARNRSQAAALVYRPANLVAAKLMLNAGRTRELESTYDSPVGLLGIRRGEPLRIDQIFEVPIVALVLQQSGRAVEAERLLVEADAAIEAVFRRGRVPTWFEADAAAVWAVQGHVDKSIRMLEHAVRRGWAHADGTDLRHFSDEPSFRPLRGNPRFEAIRAKLEVDLAREREETARVLKIPL